MSKPKDGFKKIRRAEKTRQERIDKNMDWFDYIDDSYDDDEFEDDEDEEDSE